MLRSLRLGLALSCGLPLALGFVAYVFFMWNVEKQQRRDLLLENATVLNAKVVDCLGLADSVVPEGRPRLTAEPALAELTQHAPVFTYISILDPFGRVVAYSNERGASVLEERDKERVYELDSIAYFDDLSEVYYPLLTDEQKSYGLIRLGVSDDYFRGVFSSFLLRMVPLGLLTVVLAVGAASLLARSFLGRSLGPLINSVERVSEGDFTRRVDTFTVRDELLPLSSSLNRLFETIESDKKRIHRLHSSRQEHENRIVRFKSESLERLHHLDQRASALDERFQTLLRLTWQGIVVFDQSGQVLASNAQVRRMLRLGRQGKEFYVPDPIRQVIARLFVSSSTERAEGSFEPDEEIFLRPCRYRFRAQRLPSLGGQQHVLAVFEDSTRSDQIEKEKADVSLLLHHKVLPVLGELHQAMCHLQAEQLPNAPEEALRQLWEQASARVAYLDGILHDWTYWDAKSHQTEPPASESISLVEVLRALATERLGDFSEEIHFHLPEHVEPICGAREEVQKLFRELLILLQLAVPGPQDSAVDLIADSDRLWVFLRKSVRPDQDWTAPSWLHRLAGESPATQESWVHLKLSIACLLAGMYGMKIQVDLQGEGGRQGVVFSVELPMKQTRKTQDTKVEDLIKRFFVAPV